MAASEQTRVAGYCALCWSSCGCTSVVEDGRLVAVEADPTHPTGKALCGKGLAAPDYVYSEARQLYPLKRTRPKGAADPGWQRISWDEALTTTAAAIKKARDRAGAESVAFTLTTSAGTAMQDGAAFVERLRQAFGSPNEVASIELCDFSKDFVHPHTYGVSLPPCDVENSDCIILWGHNPGTTWLAYATRITEALRRGTKLIVMDPVRVGFANKADEWLRVRPGSDGALALSLAHVMISEGLYNRDFVRDWSNAAFLVRDDNKTMLTGADLAPEADAAMRVAWDLNTNAPVHYDTQTGHYVDASPDVALEGTYTLETTSGPVSCRPAFAHYAELCAAYPPERAAEICWLPAEQIISTARLIAASNAVSYSHWAGLEMHSNTSQTGRAIACLYALTGCFDAPGGNVVYETTPINAVSGSELMPPEQFKKSLGLEKRSLGPEATFNWITTEALYDAILDREPYGVDALVSFGVNMLVSHADGVRGAAALDKLEFMVHADPFMTPTATHADIFLPVNTPWERAALKTDFLVDQRACSRVQYRDSVIESEGESQSDAWIAFQLAERLGLNAHFWDGDIDAGYREMLTPSGLDLDDLRKKPGGIDTALTTRYRKYAGDKHTPAPGFATPSKRVEIFSETFSNHGYAPLPAYVEPAMGPLSRPDLVAEFPLVLTDTKTPHYIHSQYRHVARLRRHEREPRLDVHPDTGTTRGIQDGDWVELVTPHAKARMRARFVPALDPRVVKATAGWWQACDPLDLQGYDAEDDSGANLNRTISNKDCDPIGGCVPHKSFMCEIRALAD